jgi:hypothetical protein
MSYPSQKTSGIAGRQTTHAQDAMSYGISGSADMSKASFDELVKTLEESVLEKTNRKNADIDFIRQSKVKTILERDKLQEKINWLETVEQTVTHLPFKAGDVAFHQELGNVLVEGVILSKFDDLGSLQYKIMNAKKSLVVNLNEIVPIGPTTKILYGK